VGVFEDLFRRQTERGGDAIGKVKGWVVLLGLDRNQGQAGDA
jgi:hypothetical protein